MKQRCAAVLIVLMGLGIQAYPEEVLLTPDSDVKLVVKSLQAGDTLVLQNGDWQDSELKFEGLRGTPELPIHLRPESEGGVIFSGRTEFRLSGSNVVVSGFVFRNCSGASDVMQLRSHSRRLADHCRITNCVFEQTRDLESATDSRWLSVYGLGNRIDHCYFAGKQNRGTTLVIWVGEGQGKHRIDHNHFGPRPELGRNGAETIRIGTSDVSELECGTIVEDNYFHRCDGEAEIVSNKSCGNIYRHNVFDQCAGALTLRHGHRCTVTGNVFLGRKSRGTGGVRIIGQDHVVTNNFFSGLRGDAERAAVCLMNGIPAGPLNGYAPVQRALVANNTLVDCKVTFELGLGADERQSARPESCRIRHNIIDAGKWSVFRVHCMPGDTEWSDNLQQTGKASIADQPVAFQNAVVNWEESLRGFWRPLDAQQIRTLRKTEVKQDIDGVLRTDRYLAGCDDPATDRRIQPSAMNTGPAWLSSKH